MSILAALNHVTHYRYDRSVRLAPQTIRLRPAPHSRTKVPSYALKITPANHFINWQQDPFGNYLARIVFPETATEFRIEVDLVADMSVYNPFDFFIEDSAEKAPFTYSEELHEELKPYLAHDPAGPLFQTFLAGIDTTPVATIDFLVALNRRVEQAVDYVIRMEPGVQTPAEPHFQNHHVQRRLLKQPQRRQGAVFEIGQRGVAALRLDGDEGLDDARRLHRLAIDHDALGIVVQVRRGELAHAVPGTLQQVGRQTGGRALAIGAADGQGQRRLPPQAQAVGDPGDPFEAQLNLVAVQAELPVQPLRKAGVSRRGGTRVGGHPANQPSITARRSRWPARGRGS